ncbi:MAG: nodV1, partial [Labilithrix sp.]|nr:nodV1 [Labilithrix sp.]
RKVVLAPLSRVHVAELLSDSFQQPMSSVTAMAELIHQKTGGNAFWVIHFVQSLHEEGLLTFDTERRAWTWDLARIRAQRFMENVVELMLAKLARLPDTTRSLLTELACVGPEATVAELAITTGHSDAALRMELGAAVDAGLVMLDETKVEFLHDRIQEAAYAAVAVEARASRHLEIGRRLLAATAPSERAAAAFVIANQLNRGLELVRLREERRVAREINVLAGRRALAASAHASALGYFAAAESLLEEDAWTTDDATAFECAFSLSECHVLTGDAKTAEERLLALVERPLGVTDFAAVSCLLISMYVGLDRNADAVAAGLRFLATRGIEWSAHPGAELADADAAEVWKRIGDRDIASLVELPPMTDPVDRATINVLIELYAPALFTDPDLYRLVISRMVNLTLERGSADASAFAYVWFGAFMARKGEYETGFRFGDLAGALLHRRNQARYRSRVYMVLGHFIYTYTRPLHRAREQLERALTHAQADGEPNFLVYSSSHIVSNALAAGVSLEATERDLEVSAAIFRRSGFVALEPIVVSQRYVIRSLRGLPVTFGAFPDQAAFERFVVDELKMVLVTCWMWIRKLELAVYFDDFDVAADTYPRALALAFASPSFIEEVEVVFFSALTEAAMIARAPSGERAAALRASLAAHHERLAKWAAASTAFAARSALVGAEIARADGRDLEAMRLYDVAIRSARDHDAPHHEALSAELAARFFAQRGLEEVARMHRSTARLGYLRWGASAKVEHLEAQYPYLRAESSPLHPWATIHASMGQVELAAVLRMAEATSSEIVLANLVRTLLRLVLEQSGAQRGVLVLWHDGDLVVEAEAVTQQRGIAYRLRGEDDLSELPYPERIVREALRERRAILVSDALAEAPYASDPYVVAHGARSILCLSLFRKGEPIGALYLENNLASRIFTPTQGALLELFASQVATSLENARLYDELERGRNLAAESERLSLTGSYTWTPSSGDARWSEQLYRIFEYDPNTAPSMDLVVNRVHPDDALVVGNAFRRAAGSFADFT